MRRYFIAAALLALAGCDSMPSMPNLWPFGGSDSRQAPADRRPEGSTEYRCAGNRVFYVRPMDEGAVWLIAPDREIRLSRLNDAGRYGVGRVLLEMHGDDATLADPPVNFIGCKRVAS